MSDDVDELIKEIAVKHGIALGRNDPILLLRTINQRLMDDSAKAQRAMLQEHQEQVEALAQRWGADAKEKAERVLNAALQASTAAMTRLAAEGASTAAAAVKGEVEPLLRRIASAAARSERVARWNLLAASLAAAAAAGAVAAALLLR